MAKSPKPPESPKPSAPPVPPKPPESADAIPALSIRSVPPGGFCRAGRRWVPQPQLVPLSDFTEAQIEALRAEPRLVVEDAEIVSEPEA